MELCVIEEVKPNKIFMDKLEQFRRKCKDISNDKVSEIFNRFRLIQSTIHAVQSQDPDCLNQKLLKKVIVEKQHS